MINVCELTFGYPNKQRTVFDRFTLHLDGGTVCGLLGENGVGKSALLYLMSGLLTPRHGCVLIDGMDMLQRRVAVLWRRHAHDRFRHCL